LNYVSLGMHNYFARCPQRPRALLALRPSQLAPQLTRQALLREPAGRHASPGQRALAAAGCWRLQAGPHYDAGPTCAQPVPVTGTRPTLRHLGLTGPLHQPRRGQRQRLGRFLRVPLSVFSKSFHVRGTLRGAKGADGALPPPWVVRACRPLRLKRFSTQVCVEI